MAEPDEEGFIKIADEETPINSPGTERTSKFVSAFQDVTNLIFGPRVYALLGGVCMMIESIFEFFVHAILKNQPRKLIIDVYSVLFGLFMVVIESGWVGTGLEGFVAENLPVVHDVQKRGILYILFGCLQFTRESTVPGGLAANYLGLWVVLVGASYATLGFITKRRTENMRKNITYAPIQAMALETGGLTPRDFRKLLKRIGMKLTWLESEILFTMLDKNFDRVLSFADVKAFFERD